LFAETTVVPASVEPNTSIATENPPSEETASTTEVAGIDQDIPVPLATEKQI
jgi:hypothetical protein